MLFMANHVVVLSLFLRNTIYVLLSNLTHAFLILKNLQPGL